jgi:AcrR family transcriptional regulator
MVKNLDTRITRTEKCLKEALISLMSLRNLDEVRVQNICTKAGVNRGTFYKHYEDKYDLFNAILEDLVNDVEKIGGRYLKNDTNSDIISTLGDLYMLFAVDLMKYFIKQQKIFKGIVVNNKDSLAYFMFSNKMQEAYVSFLSRMRPFVKFEIPADVISLFCTSGLIHLVMYWLETGQISNLEENTFSIRAILQHNLYIQK